MQVDTKKLFYIMKLLLDKICISNKDLSPGKWFLEVTILFKNFIYRKKGCNSVCFTLNNKWFIYL